MYGANAAASARVSACASGQPGAPGVDFGKHAGTDTGGYSRVNLPPPLRHLPAAVLIAPEGTPILLTETAGT